MNLYCKRLRALPTEKRAWRRDYLYFDRLESSDSEEPDDLTHWQVKDLKARLHGRLWQCVHRRDFFRMEETLELFRAHRVPYVEVTYALMVHGYRAGTHEWKARYPCTMSAARKMGRSPVKSSAFQGFAR